MDPLRAHWDFDDLDTSERRFRELLEAETEEAARAEILTQLARVHGMRGDFERGEELIREAERAAGSSAVAGVRIDLERGRLRRSSGDAEAALPLFEAAFEKANEAREPFLAADAAHMAALAAPDREGFVAWTTRGIEIAESEDAAAGYWLGPLLNNLGWELYEGGEYEDALDAFERALRARERDPENEAALEIARYAVGKTLRALGRPAEAAALARTGSRPGRSARASPTAGSTRSWRRTTRRSAARRKRASRPSGRWRFFRTRTRASRPTTPRVRRLRDLADAQS